MLELDQTSSCFVEAETLKTFEPHEGAFNVVEPSLPTAAAINIPESTAELARIATKLLSQNPSYSPEPKDIEIIETFCSMQYCNPTITSDS